MSKPSDLIQGTLDLLILRTVALEPVHNLQKRYIRLGDGFVEPILLQEIVVLGVANKR